MELSAGEAFPARVLNSLKRGLRAVQRVVRRNYNRLIDLCFWIQFAIQGKSLLQIFMVLPEPFYPQTDLGQTAYFIQMTLGTITLPTLLLLLTVGGIRDEFSERLWAKTSTSFARFLIVFLFLWAFMADTIFPWKSADALHHPIPNILPLSDVALTDCVNLGFHQLEAMNFIVIQELVLIPIILAGFYKWHRWRSGN